MTRRSILIDDADAEVNAVVGRYQRHGLFRQGVALALVGVFLASLFATGGLEFARYGDAGRAIIAIILESMPPDFTRAPSWLLPIFETVAMSIAASLLGVAVAVPLGIVAARNMGAHRLLATTARLVLDATRSVPELVFGIIFVAAVGFGPLAGVLALGFHSIGMLGRFITEYIEHVDPEPGQIMEGHGVSRLGIIRFCVLPQILPRIIDLTLYRWEHNIRAASVVGMVGAGGIGLEIVAAFSLFEYQAALALIIVIFGLVFLIDGLGSLLRRKFNLHLEST